MTLPPAVRSARAAWTALAVMVAAAVVAGLVPALRPLVSPAGSVGSVLLVLAVFAVAKNPIVNGFYVAYDRYVRGDAYAGDAARQAAMNIRQDLRPGDLSRTGEAGAGVTDEARRRAE